MTLEDDFKKMIHISIPDNSLISFNKIYLTVNHSDNSLIIIQYYK